MEIKSLIKQKRLERGMTMKELSEKIGVSEATISRWESGVIDNMRRDKIATLAAVLDIPPSVIMGWDKKDNGNPLIAELVDVAKGCDDKDIMQATEMLRRMKAYNDALKGLKDVRSETR